MGRLTDKQWIELTIITVDTVHKGLRQGQAYMNALHYINKELYEQITGTENDCFYDDNKIVNFIKFLNSDEQNI